VAGLSASENPVLRGNLLLLPAAGRPFFFVGQPWEVQKTLRTLLPEAPSSQAQRVLNMVSHVACCSSLVHHEGQHLWLPTAHEHIARNHVKKADLQSVEDFFNPALHGNAALSVVYGSEHAVAWESCWCRMCTVKRQNSNTAMCCCAICLDVYVAHGHILQPLPGIITSWMLASIQPTDDFMYVCCASSQPCAHLGIDWWPETNIP